MNIYFLRHGQTICAGTYTGITDVPLSENGVCQIHQVSLYLREIVFDICYCSPLIRCRKTLEIIEIPTEKIYDTDLVEINFGRWETRSFNQIYQEDQHNMELWFKVKEAFSFPEGDNISEFSFRVKGWVEQLKKKPFANILVVSHAGVIRHAITHLLGLQINQADQFEVVEGHVSMVSVDNDFAVLKFLNKAG